MNCDSVQTLCSTASLDASTAEMCCAGVLAKGFASFSTFLPVLLGIGLLSGLAAAIKFKGLNFLICQTIDALRFICSMFAQKPTTEAFENPTTNGSSQRFSVESSVSVEVPDLGDVRECEENSEDEEKVSIAIGSLIGSL